MIEGHNESQKLSNSAAKSQLSLYSYVYSSLANMYSSVCGSLNNFTFILTPYGLENRSFSFEENHLQTDTVHNCSVEIKVLSEITEA